MNIAPISCIIIDDDNFSRNYLNDMLTEFPEINVVESLSESSMAIRHLAVHKPDIAFLDIDMPKKDGLSILNEINELGIDTKVIFVTSYEHYVLDALKKNAFDYLVKPVKKQVLCEALARFNESVLCGKPAVMNIPEPDANNKLIIQNAHGTLIVKHSDIAYIEAEGSYTNINMVAGGIETISKNIGKVEKQFNSNLFFKISRSCIINISYLSKIDRLKRIVHLQYGDKKISLKASKELLYDLESFIHKC